MNEQLDNFLIFYKISKDVMLTSRPIILLPSLSGILWIKHFDLAKRNSGTNIGLSEISSISQIHHRHQQVKYIPSESYILIYSKSVHVYANTLLAFGEDSKKTE